MDKCQQRRLNRRTRRNSTLHSCVEYVSCRLPASNQSFVTSWLDERYLAVVRSGNSHRSWTTKKCCELEAESATPC